MKRLWIMLIILCAASAQAELSKYAKWDRSPQAYFMTAEEQQQWSAVKTDEEAAKFEAEFLARRQPSFAPEVAKRVEMADKYLTIGQVKGSGTLRGRLIVVFGAPANVAISDRVAKKDYSSSAGVAGMTDVSGGASVEVDEGGVSQQIGSGQAGRAFRDYTFTFSAKSIPSLGKDYEVIIEADAGTGTDRIKDRRRKDDLEAKLSAAAKAMLK